MIGIYQFLLSTRFPVLDGIAIVSVTFSFIWHLTVYTFLLSISNFTMRQLNILVSIVNFKFHHAATQYPGHGTKFVTLPSSTL